MYLVPGEGGVPGPGEGGVPGPGGRGVYLVPGGVRYPPCEQNHTHL